MKIKFSDKVSNLEPSATLAMAGKAQELISQGIDVVNMSLGEPDFFTPDFIKEAAKEAIDQNFSFYPPVPGFSDLRDSICHKLKRDNDLDYSRDQIVVSTGAKQSLANLILALVNPGDEVIIPAPYWVSYRDLVLFAEGVPITPLARIDQDYKITPSQLKDCLTPKTKLFLFSNPSNPTGSIYSKVELKGLFQVLESRPDIVIISDEIYEHIYFEHKVVSTAHCVNTNPVVTVNGLSKGFAMTGWRLGYIAAPLEIASACSKIQSQFTSGACSITQRAAIRAMKENPQSMEYMRQEFLKRRNILIKELQKIPGIKLNFPSGAFYLFINIDDWLRKGNYQNCAELSLEILDKVHVAMTPGGPFGAPGHLRLSYATSESKILEAASRLSKFYQSL